MAQRDPRRQPQQPPRWLRGVIPANYFGSGKPAQKLAQPGVKYEVDQWVLANSGYSGNATEIGPCRQRFFTWNSGRYEEACGCVDLDPAFYPVSHLNSSGQSCYQRYAGAQICERSQFNWSGGRYEQACGCSGLGGEYYAVSSVGSEGQTCKHKYLGPATP